MKSSAKYFAVNYLMFLVALSGLIVTCQGKASVTLSSTWEVPSEEASAQSLVQIRINDFADLAGYTTYTYHGPDTTKENILEAASSFGHSYAIVWYVGHGWIRTWTHYWGWPWQWHGHKQMLIVADDGTRVYDYEIYPETSGRNTRFVFLWSCEVGEEVGYMKTYPCGETKAYGMPFAWLHTTDLSSNGYENPDGKGYVFIGFREQAPFLTADYVENVTNGGEWFTISFYRGALENGLSIIDALDYAAQYEFSQQTFADTELYQGIYDDYGQFVGYMKVYGDGNQKLAVHDVAVTSVTASLPYGATAVYPGWTISVSVTVKNVGDYTENFNVIAYANSTIIGTKTVSLAPGQTSTLTFVWTVPTPTWTFPYPHYTISAKANVVPGEIHTINNLFVDGSVTVKHWGDADCDGDVDADDIFTYMAPAYGSKYGQTNYNPNCDFDGDGDVDSDDMYTYLAPYYGQNFRQW